MLGRPSRDEYYLQMAVAAARRSTCPRASVGAVIVGRHDDVLAIGFNGAPSGLPHCTEVGCMIRDNHCLRTVHAEANALVRAGRLSRGATIYCTHFPCLACSLLVINVGITRVVYANSYHDEVGIEFLKAAGITVQRVAKS